MSQIYRTLSAIISFICLHWNKISLLKYLDVSFVWSIHIILEHMHMYGNCALQKAPIELWQQLKVRKTTHAGQQVQGRRTSTTHIDDIFRCHQHFLVITVILMTVCSELAQRVADFTAERFYMVIFYRRTPFCPIAGSFWQISERRKLPFGTRWVMKQLLRRPPPTSRRGKSLFGVSRFDVRDLRVLCPFYLINI